MSTDTEISFDREEETAFAVPLKRAAIRDSRVSLGARGLFHFLWDLPRDWRARQSHLVSVTGTGKTRLRGFFSELQEIGALRLEPKRLTADEAVRLSEEKGKIFRAGQVCGTTWKIVHPDKWAVETSISRANQSKPATVADSTESQETRLSVKPTVGKPDAKVLLLKGSAIKTTTTESLEEKSASSCGLDGLEIHPCLLTHLKTLRLSAQLALARRQLLLDEVAGNVIKGLVKNSPARLLNALVKKEQAGEFHPDLAAGIAENRRASAETAARLAAARDRQPGDEQNLRQGRTPPPGGSAMEMLRGVGVFK